MRGVTGIGLDPIPSRANQLRWCRDGAFDLNIDQRPGLSETGRASFVGDPHRAAQSLQPSQDLAVIGAQPRPFDVTGFLIDGMRNHRKRMHIQPNTRTVETHRRPPDLQMWLYPASVHPPKATHVLLQPEAFGLKSPPYRLASPLLMLASSPLVNDQCADHLAHFDCVP
jgi:hypothetical protein